MTDNILFETDAEKQATERVLALVKTKTISKKIDELVSEVITYASSIDKILEKKNLPKRYLDRVSSLADLVPVYVDEDVEASDFRVKEIVEHLIKRINTRISLIKSNDEIIKELSDTYNFDENMVLADIDLARLKMEDFIE